MSEGCWKKAGYHVVGHVTRGPCFGTRATCQNKATIVTLRISSKLWHCAAFKIQLYMKHDETPKIVMSNGTGKSEHHAGIIFRLQMSISLSEQHMQAGPMPFLMSCQVYVDIGNLVTSW